MDVVNAKTKNGLWVLFACILCIQVFVLIRQFTYIGFPFPGFSISTELSNNNLIYKTSSRYNSDNIPPHESRILQIEDQPINSSFPQLFQSLFAHGKKNVSITYLYGDQTYTKSYALRPITFSDVIEGRIRPSIFFASYMLIAYSLLMRQKSLALNSAGAAFMCILVGNHMGLMNDTFFLYLPDWKFRLINITLVGIHSLSGGFFGGYMIVGLLCYPWVVRNIHFWIKILLGIGLCIGFTRATSEIYFFRVVLYQTGFEIAQKLNNSILLEMGYQLIAGFFAYIRLSYETWQHRFSTIKRNQALLPLLGYTIGLIGYIAWPLDVIVWKFNDILPSEIYFAIKNFRDFADRDTIMWQFFVPLSFGYALLRHHENGNKIAFMAIFSIAFSAVFSKLGDLIYKTQISNSSLSIYTFLFIIIFLVSIIWLWQQSERSPLRRLFQWQSTSYTAAERIGSELLSDPRKLNPKTIANAIVIATSREFNLEACALWLPNLAQHNFVLAAQQGITPSRSIEIRQNDANTLAVKPILTEHTSVFTHIAPTIQAIIPLFVGNELKGILGIGKRRDEQIFNTRDLQVFNLVGQQVALFLLSAEQIQALRKQRELIAEGQERERESISQELHDSTQQFFGRFQFYLADLRQIMQASLAPALPATPNIQRDLAEFDQLLEKYENEVEHEAMVLRRLRLSLSPIQLESSLIRPLEALTGRFVSISKVNIALNYDAQIDALLLHDSHKRHTLYRVIEQAMTNTIKHAHAKNLHVQVSCNTEHTRIDFDISDDGIGFDENRANDAKASGHAGLIIMTERVQAIGGECHINSAPHAGTHIQGWVPITPTQH